MDEEEVGTYWNQNAEAWTALARAGYDVYRDYLNTPAFFELLTDINGLTGIDIGCGEGYNTRLLAQKAKMTAIDVSKIFIEKAKEVEKENSLGINYSIASATKLPFPNACFDFATSIMCLMDIPQPEKAIQEISRALKPGGFLQFSIEHPCFNFLNSKRLKNAEGKTYAVQVENYFGGTDGEISEWIFGNTPQEIKNKFPKFKIPSFHRTLSFWINTLLMSGLNIEKISEPCPGDKVISAQPSLINARAVPLFLHIRCRKEIRCL